MSMIGTTIGINTEDNSEFAARYANPYSAICDPALEQVKVERAFKLANDVLMRFRLIIQANLHYIHMPVSQVVHNPDDCIQFHGPVIRLNQYITVTTVMLIDELDFLIGEDRRTSRYPGQDEMQIHFMLKLSSINNHFD